ncbi:MAG: RNA pseudouridine synthase [Deltaproteobacteria bacterium]|nr:MAG: RNA pseudouridine synthase [Deltaproteobacteria bacterium]
MHEAQKNFKGPKKKFQPRGISILYEDQDILVVDKINGLLTVSSDKVKENTAYFLLTKYVRKGNPKSRNRIFIVHRLDRDTSGVIVFAKSERAKFFLQKEWHNFKKKYLAVVHGTLPKAEGIITSYLAENRAHKMYSVDDPKNGKLAQTAYKTVRESERFSLLEIELLTGRKNQIRVHFADQGCPVAGDKVYGEKAKGIKRLTLHAATINIIHPHTKQPLTFTAEVPTYFNSLLNS